MGILPFATAATADTSGHRSQIASAPTPTAPAPVFVANDHEEAGIELRKGYGAAFPGGVQRRLVAAT